jgi:hypothetical protein
VILIFLLFHHSFFVFELNVLSHQIFGAENVFLLRDTVKTAISIALKNSFFFLQSMGCSLRINGWTKHGVERFVVLSAASMKMAVFWVVAPCILIEVYRRFRGACCLHHQGESSSETSVNFYQTTRCNNPKDSHPHGLRRKDRRIDVLRQLEHSDLG